MRKVFLSFAAVLAALFVLGPASASAAPPPAAVACLGAVDNQGSFFQQEVNLSLPGGGLGLAPTLCAGVAPEQVNEWLENTVNQALELGTPTELPTAEDLEAFLNALQEFDPSNPLGALLLVFQGCESLKITKYCQFVLGAALGGPLPIGQSVSLQGNPGNNCFSGDPQTGTGSAFVGGNFYSLEWSADYKAGNDVVGVISGTAKAGFGPDAPVYPLRGYIGLGCGAGAKGLVLMIENNG